MDHSLNTLQSYCRSIATRPFKARGSVVKRCQQCLMAETACFCQWRKPQQSNIEFILIMHRNEVLKPTNTGRLIADLFPDNTYAFLWDRTEPSQALINILNDHSRETLLLFLSDNTTPLAHYQRNKDKHKPLRIVLLDGTWKQASKMARLSPWLQHLPCIHINTENLSAVEFIRKAPNKGQLSTAQAAVCVLHECGEERSAEILQHYFTVFNQHSLATRQSITPEESPSHIFLEKL